MTFLPIVGRELRVAARRRATYWTRVVGAGVVLILFGGILLIAQLARAGPSQIGPWLFNTFTWLAFAFVCAAGLFFTSDCLSEEKREGTLGLLFLTDLRGHDVVLGKLLAQSLLGAYGLLAAFPMIGLSFLLGGVSGFEFWRLILVLLNTLFFSLAAGVCVSAIVRDTQRALSLTFLICLVFIVILPLADFALAKWTLPNFKARLSLASPGYAFLQFRGTTFSDFWWVLGATHLLSWILLGLACFLAPRRWQDRTESTTGPRRWWLRLSSPARRAAWREKLLAANPVRWLAARDPWMTRVVLVAMLAVIILYGLCWKAGGTTVAIGLAYVGRWLLSVVLILWLASQASRFFVDASRNGVLELVLATPLPARHIVLGHWWALRRSFLIPAVLLFLGIAAQGLWQVLTILKSMAVASGAAMAAATNSATAGTNAVAMTPVTVNWQNDFVIQQLIALALTLLNYFVRLLAVAWFGMWMGVTNRKPNVAVMKTVLYVGVFPWMGYWFVTMMMYAATGLLTMGTGSGRFLFWLPTLVSGLLLFALNLFFFFLARHKLLVRFRETFTRSLGLRLKPPPPLPPTVPPTLPAAPAAA